MQGGIYGGRNCDLEGQKVDRLSKVIYSDLKRFLEIDHPYRTGSSFEEEMIGNFALKTDVEIWGVAIELRQHMFTLTHTGLRQAYSYQDWLEMHGLQNDCIGSVEITKPVKRWGFQDTCLQCWVRSITLHSVLWMTYHLYIYHIIITQYVRIYKIT